MINHLSIFMRVRWLILIYLSINTTHNIPPCKCRVYWCSAGSLPAPTVSSGNGLGLLSFRLQQSSSTDPKWQLSRASSSSKGKRCYILRLRLLSTRAARLLPCNFTNTGTNTPIVEHHDAPFKLNPFQAMANVTTIFTISPFGLLRIIN